MPHRGNAYQSIIFAAQQALDETGELPRTNAALAALSGLDEGQVSNIFRTKADICRGAALPGRRRNDALRQGVIEAATDDPVQQMLSIGRSFSPGPKNPACIRLLANGLNGEIQPTARCTASPSRCAISIAAS